MNAGRLTFLRPVGVVLCVACMARPASAQSQSVAERIKDLDSDRPLVREEALELLAAVGPRANEALPKLKALFKDPRPTVRLRAAAAALRIGAKDPPALSVLAEAGAKGGHFERLLALETALPLAGDHAGTAELLGKALADPNIQERAKVESLLTRLGPAAVPALLKVIGAAEPDVVLLALRNLERKGTDAAVLGPAVRPLLKDRPPVVRALAISCLLRGRANPESLLPVIGELLKEKNAEAERVVYAAIYDSPVRSKSLVPILEAALAGGDPYQKVRAAGALWETDGRTKETVPVIVAAMGSGPNYAGRSAAQVVLPRMGPAAAEVVPAVMELVRADAGVAPSNFIYFFGQWGDAAAGPFAKYLADDNARVRSTAIQALGVLGEKGVAPLVKAYEKADAAQRLEILRAFGTMRARAEEAVPLLIEVLSKGDREEARAAATTLYTVGPAGAKAVPRVVEMLKERAAAADVRQYLYNFVGAVGPWAAGSAPALVAIVKDKSFAENERQSALYALAHVGPPAGHAEELLEIADKSNGLTRVRALAAALKIDPGNKKVAETLSALLKQAAPDTRFLIPNLFEFLPDDTRECPEFMASLVEYFAKSPPANMETFINAVQRRTELDPASIKYLTERAVAGQPPSAASAAVALATRGILDEPRVVAQVEGVLLNLNDGRRLPLLRELPRHGPKAKPLADVLLRCWERESATATRLAAAEALAAADPAKARPLADWLREQAAHAEPQFAAPALLVLGRIDRTADPVPALRKLLGSAYLSRHAAAEALGRLGAAARAAVPDLEAALKSPDYPVRLQSALALWKIDPTSDRYRAALAEALKDRRPTYVIHRTNVLADLGGRGKEAARLVPALLAAARHSDSYEKTYFLQAIHRLDPAAIKNIKAD